MTVQLSPLPMQRFYDNNNNPLVGGQLFTYQAGTTTPIATFTDSTAITANTNPVVMNARGEAAVWLLAAQAYKFVLEDASGNVIWTEDNITAPSPVAVGNMTDEKGSGGGFGFVAGVDFTAGTTTQLTLSQFYGSASNLWVAFDAAEQGADQFSLNGKVITFVSPIPSGTNKVFIKGGTSLSIGVPGNATVGDAQLAWGNTLGRVCDSIAALGALSVSTYTRAFVTGYYAAGDGGGGPYSYSSSTSQALANGGTIIAAAGGVGCWVLQYIGGVDIRQFGAKVDGATDDSTAVQACINYLQSKGGGKALFPQGTTALSGITIPCGGITLEGMGWEEYTGYQGQFTPGQIGTHGSYIKQLSTATSAITITNGANHSTVRGIAFFQTQPADTGGWTPTVYAPTINCLGSGAQPGGAALLENLFCWNCYEFIRVGAVGAPCSRVTMKHIWGMPLAFGIRIFFSSDTNLIEDVHFWQFNQNVPDIISWVQANGIAITISRSDNFVMSNVFIFGYQVGLQLTSSTDGSSQNFQINNIGLDSVNVGLQVIPTAGACNGTISNIYVAGNSGVALNNMLIGNSAAIFITMTNVRLLFSQNSAVAVGLNSDVSITNLYVANWNQANIAAAVFSIGSSSTVTLSGRLVTVNGNGAAANSGAGTYNATHVN